MQSQLKKYVLLSVAVLLQALFIVGIRYALLKQCRQWWEKEQVRQANFAAITEDIKGFPIPLPYRDEVYYEDTYGAARGNGGHEGCDIMDENDKPGQIPVVSATDGTVTNVGWLYLGGYRIGITSEHGIYYYYAHLDSYAAGMTAGKQIKTGELLGFMGNTGEGEEGTSGKFPVHLHFGIYIQNETGKEESVNPYSFLRKIDGR